MTHDNLAIRSARPATPAEPASPADENRAEDDLSVRTDDVTLLVDPMSIQYLMGSEVDYTEGLQGSQFVVRNPNATTTCGCGSSFSA